MARLFFVSVPKAGKNVVQTFLAALGLVPADLTCRHVAATFTHARWAEGVILSGAPFPPRLTLAAVRAEIARLQPDADTFLDELVHLRDGAWVNQHFAFDERLYETLRRCDIPIVFLHRDPREVLLSMANFLVHRGQPADFLARLPERTLEHAVRFLWNGSDEQLPFARMFDPYVGWLAAPGVLSLRFDDIIGRNGGGDPEAQRRHLSALAEHCRWSGPPAALERAVQAAYNPAAGTFHRGQIGAWKADLPAEWIDGLTPRLERLLARWGCTSDGADLRIPLEHQPAL